MPSYYAKNEQVQGRQLKVQKLSLPFSVTGHATPASKTVTRDDPGVLFLNFEGVSSITVAAGACDAGTLAALTLVGTDTTGIFTAMVSITEVIDKLLVVRLHKRGSATDVAVGATYTTGTTAGLCTTAGTTDTASTRLAVNFDSATDFSAAATSNWVLELEYQVVE